MKSRYYLSIIIPCFNEAHRLPVSLVQLKTFITKQKYPIETIFVNDGSKDNTNSILKIFIKQNQISKKHTFRLIEFDYNTGKGSAVQKGILSANGAINLFTDADFSTPLSEINKLIIALKTGYDVAIGSRELATSLKSGEPRWRSFIGKSFRWILQIAGLKGDIKDTQCGFKAFRKEAAQLLFQKQRLRGGSFDIEIIFLARLFNLKYKEIPVVWKHVSGSTINVVHDMLYHPIDLVKIYLYYGLGYYR